MNRKIIKNNMQAIHYNNVFCSSFKQTYPIVWSIGDGPCHIYMYMYINIFKPTVKSSFFFQNTNDAVHDSFLLISNETYEFKIYDLTVWKDIHMNTLSFCISTAYFS